MDNLTHTLAALALTRVPGVCRSRFSAPALVLAANLPDMDVLARPFLGVVGYLEYHRGITHSVVGVVVQIFLFGALAHGLERWRTRRRSTGPEATRVLAGWREGPLLAVAVGLVSHPLLDLLNVYGVRPWLPVSETWVYGDLVFVAEPWLWLLLGLAVWLPARRSRGIDVAAVVVFLLTSLVVFVLEKDRAPPLLRAVWIPAFMALAACRWRGYVRWARPLGCAGAAIYVMASAGLRDAARDLARPALEGVAAGEEEVEVVALPTPARPHAWSFIAHSRSRVWIAEVDVASRQVRLVLERARGLDDPRVQAALATPAGRAFLRFARVPLADRTSSGVRFRDARYLHTGFLDVTVLVSE